MVDLFIRWIQKKITLHHRINRPSYRERDIFWCSFGENVWDEENGKWAEFTRPVLVIRKFNKNIFLGIPLSTKIKPENPFYIEITMHGSPVSALISQIRILDTKRIHKHIGTLDKKDFQKVLYALRDIVFKNFTPSIAEGGVATDVDL